MASKRAQALAAETGAFVYWQNADEAAARMESDMAVFGAMAEILQ